MKDDLVINYNDSKQGIKKVNKTNTKYLKIGSLPNKLLSDMVKTYIKNKGNVKMSFKNHHINLKKNIKPTILLSNDSNKRLYSAEWMKNKNITPRSKSFNSIECNSLKRNAKYSVKHENYSAININENSYNFHKRAPKKIINQDKKLLIYVNKNSDKILMKDAYENENEKNSITPRYYINEYKQKENINKLPLTQKKNNFHLINQKQSREFFQKHKLLETRYKLEKNMQVKLKKSQSIKNISRGLLDKNNREIEKLTYLIKEEVKHYFIKHRFSSVKDYFNDWLYYKRNKDDQKKINLDEDSIYYYLKEKIRIKINRNEVQKIFKSKKKLFDINHFKNFFFEDKEISNNDSQLSKHSLFSSYKKLNKSKGLILCSFSNIFNDTKNKMPKFKNNLLISKIEEHKTKIIEKICRTLIGNKRKTEYDFFEFYSLFKSLNIDKNLINKNVIKKIFSFYKKENGKVDIKYFINQCYKSDKVKNELFPEKNENEKNIVEPPKQIQSYCHRKPISLHLNKIEFPFKAKSKYMSHLNINKEQINNNISELKNPSSQVENEKIKFKSTSPSIKVDMNFNKKNDNSSQINKFMKFSQSQVMNKLKQKKIYNLYDSSSKSNILTGIMRANNQKRELNLNSYKTIRIKKNYQSNTINNITSKPNNDNNNKNKKAMERPVSAYNKCLLGIYNNNFKNYSKLYKLETLKFISEDSNIPNLNSDIINLI